MKDQDLWNPDFQSKSFSVVDLRRTIHRKETSSTGGTDTSLGFFVLVTWSGTPKRVCLVDWVYTMCHPSFPVVSWISRSRGRRGVRSSSRWGTGRETLEEGQVQGGAWFQVQGPRTTSGNTQGSYFGSRVGDSGVWTSSGVLT